MIEDGFYYDFDREEPFSDDDFEKIEARMREIIAAKDPVRTEVWSREQAIKHYEAADEPFKVELIGMIPEGEDIRMYWHGHWQDLCRGPHLAHTGQCPPDAFKLMSVAGAYWRGNSDNKMLQRIYAVAFKSKKDLDAWLHQREEALKRDHRKLGKQLELFHLQEEAPGMVFWHPNGWSLYRSGRGLYAPAAGVKAGYQEIKTPQVVDRKLWEASGHWDKYRENMFITEIDEEHANEKRTNALKPMNCPCHVQVFNQGLKSYRDLPLRLAEFGSCHRYESSGSAARADAGARLRAGRCAYLLHRGSDRARDQGLHRSLVLGLRRISVSPNTASNSPTGRKCAPGRTRCGTKPKRRCAARRWPRAWMSRRTRATGRSTGRSSISWSPTPSGANGNAARCRPISCCRTGWTRNMSGKTTKSTSPVMLHRAIFGSFERFLGILIENHAGAFPALARAETSGGDHHRLGRGRLRR